MCGRFHLKFTAEELAAVYEAIAKIQSLPRYNIAPTQSVPVIRLEGRQRVIRQLRWGLIPHWMDQHEQAPVLINARSETVEEKPAFRKSFQRRRCLIPATGFYEWTGGKQKSPHNLQLKSGAVFAMAGIWDRCETPQGQIESCTILTLPPNELVAEYHNRMPVILPQDQHASWLDPQTNVENLKPMFHPMAAENMECWSVSKQLNQVGFDSPDALKPCIDAQKTLF